MGPTLPPMSRRRFLATVGAAGAGAFLASWLPSVVDRAYALADPAGTGSLADIEHFVFLMQENRSFDHYFGTLSGVRGFSDPTVATQIVDGRTYDVFHQFGYQVGVGPTPTGYMLPFAFQSDATHDDQCLNDPTHDWAPQHQCWNGGHMDRWLPVHIANDGAANGPIVMGYYDRSTLPFYYDLADAFTICDHYHCSVLGPTYPNRAYWMSGMLDPDGLAGGPILATLSDVLPNPASWGYLRWKTMPEVLEEAGVTWKVYQSSDAVGGFQGGLLMDNILRLFKQYSTPGPLFDQGLLPTLEADFVSDVATGKLPAVSWIVTDFTECEHPAAPPSYGGVAVAQVLDTLTSNPAVWEKTALVISYDENGGFFDHVPPPFAPPGTAGEYVTKPPPTPALGSTGGIAGPIGLGFRVPCLVISPYSRGGLVFSGVSDHTSQLRLLESRFAAPVPNLSAWRRSAVSDLTGAFDFAAAPDSSATRVTPILDPYLAPDVAANGALGTAGKGIPYPYPAISERPVQEPGTRRQPSGIVSAAVTTTTTTTVSTTGTSVPATTITPAASPGQTLPLTGDDLYQDAVKGAALVMLGGALTMAAGAPGPEGIDDGSAR